MWQRNWIGVGVVLICLPTITLQAVAQSYPANPTGTRNWCTPGVRCAATWKCWGDDYCSPRLPFTPCYSIRTCYDDYCKKGLPGEPKTPCRTGCDDYCKKSCPVRLW